MRLLSTGRMLTSPRLTFHRAHHSNHSKEQQSRHKKSLTGAGEVVEYEAGKIGVKKKNRLSRDMRCVEVSQRNTTRRAAKPNLAIVPAAIRIFAKVELWCGAMPQLVGRALGIQQSSVPHCSAHRSNVKQRSASVLTPILPIHCTELVGGAQTKRSAQGDLSRTGRLCHEQARNEQSQGAPRNDFGGSHVARHHVATVTTHS